MPRAPVLAEKIKAFLRTERGRNMTDVQIGAEMGAGTGYVRKVRQGMGYGPTRRARVKAAPAAGVRHYERKPSPSQQRRKLDAKERASPEDGLDYNRHSEPARRANLRGFESALHDEHLRAVAAGLRGSF